MNESKRAESFECLAAFKFDGQAALRRVLEQSQYAGLEQAVASLAAFSHPMTVRLIRANNVFSMIRTRDNKRRGEIVAVDGKQRAMLDDNKAPTDAFIWANGIRRGLYRDVQFNHLWSAPEDVHAYTNLANICVMPAFLSKLTDTDSRVQSLLRYRACELYGGYYPSCSAEPEKPEGYDALLWADPLPFASDLEARYRRAMRTKPKDRTTFSARQLGWVFSGFKPDGSL